MGRDSSDNYEGTSDEQYKPSAKDTLVKGREYLVEESKPTLDTRVRGSR